ncbi:SRPBCC family protein [Leifsonia sp. NPDC080035]|uniref:SRPBCC family protein n=1 Tax=Leifsonia sp. NPDC080035 TaxID=3143936 RepID=A0AAU7GCX2_9MICO
MVQITNSIDIQAPAARVYAALRALDAYPAWLRHSAVYRGTRAPAGPPAAGVAYVDSTTVGRMRGELLEDVPGRSLRFHQAKPSGTLDALIRYDLAATADGGGTRVTRVGDLTTRGMLRAAQPVLVRMAAAESRRTMTALKRHVEAGR